MSSSILNLKEFYSVIKSMGYEMWTMGKVSEGKMIGYSINEGDPISLELWNGQHWHFSWVGGIGVVVKTLDSIGSDREYIEKERAVIESIISKLS